MNTPELTGQFWSLQDGTKKESTDDVEPLFPPIPMSAKVLAALVGNGRGSIEVGDDDDDERASEATAIQQPPSVTNSRKHGRGEDGANGALSGGEKTGVPDKKKRRRLGAPHTPAASTTADRPDGLDGDKAMIDSTTEESPPIEEIRPITNGCSIGVQVETVTEIAPSETTVLTNDEQGVNKVAWSPVEPGKLVSGPRSSKARIWSISTGFEPPSHIILDHSSTLFKKQEVTAVQWSIDGTMLATGTFDGSTKIWNPLGASISVLVGKPSPIIDLRWNKASTILLSVYLDGGLLAWDIKTGGNLKSFEFVQEVAWVGDETFAVAFNDGDIVLYIARTGEARVRFKGEEGVGITSLAWDEFGERLASGDAKGRIAVRLRSHAPPALEQHLADIISLDLGKHKNYS